MTKTAIYPGTFDPVTFGHLDIITRALEIFDKLYVAVANNTSKAPIFSTDERIDFIRRATKSSKKKVIVEAFDGLVVKYAAAKKTNVMIRGIRATSDFDYELPPELIAQEPIEPRDASRLLVLDRRTKTRQHLLFRELPRLLNPGDLLVVNRSRVVPARLFALKLPGGGKVELLLLERINGREWKSLVGGKGLQVGSKVKLENGLLGEITEDLGGPQRRLVFDRGLDSSLQSFGQVPLPPYIHTPLANPERYQTVFARVPGLSLGRMGQGAAD